MRSILLQSWKRNARSYRMGSSSFPLFFFLPFVPIAFSLPPQSLFSSPGQLGIGHRLESEIGSSAGAAFAAVPMAQETAQTNATKWNENPEMRKIKSDNKILHGTLAAMALGIFNSRFRARSARNGAGHRTGCLFFHVLVHSVVAFVMRSRHGRRCRRRRRGGRRRNKSGHQMVADSWRYGRQTQSGSRVRQCRSWGHWLDGRGRARLQMVMRMRQR